MQNEIEQQAPIEVRVAMLEAVLKSLLMHLAENDYTAVSVENIVWELNEWKERK